MWSTWCSTQSSREHTEAVWERGVSVAAFSREENHLRDPDSRRQSFTRDRSRGQSPGPMPRECSTVKLMSISEVTRRGARIWSGAVQLLSHIFPSVCCEHLCHMAPARTVFRRDSFPPSVYTCTQIGPAIHAIDILLYSAKKFIK